MTDSIIERAARALHEEECRSHQVETSPWNSVPDGRKRLFRDQARAVLAAIREPDDRRFSDRLEGEYRPGSHSARQIWQAIIDAALTEDA